jgi:hypothetical protein
MKNPSIKLLFVFAVLLAWSGATTWGDCDDPLGGSNCQAQDLDSNDPPGGDECGPIVVTSATSSESTLIVKLSNPSASTEEGFVVTTVLLAGKEYVNVIPVALTAESTATLLVVFPRTFTAIGAYACGDKPGGINEGPDVVGIIHEEEPE